MIGMVWDGMAWYNYIFKGIKAIISCYQFHLLICTVRLQYSQHSVSQSIYTTCATCPKSRIDPQDGLDFALETTQKPKKHPLKISLTNHIGILFHFFH